MPRKATKASDNVLYCARIEAAKWNDKLNSREGASEITGLDRTRIACMELGTITPYPEEVLMLSDAYNAPELCNHYCSSQCPIGKHTVERLELKELEAATLQLLSSLRGLPEMTDNLVGIVEDGKVEDRERPEIEAILEKLRHATKKIQTLELIYRKKLRAHTEGIDG